MNNEIKQLIDEAEYYSPSAEASIISGGTETLQFRTLRGSSFAFNRMNIGSDNPAALNQITVTAKMNEGRNTLFQDVQLEALKRLFATMSLRGGFVIDFNKALELETTNGSANTRRVNIDLNGYDGPHFEAKEIQYESRGEMFPEPQFVYANATIAANADQQRVKMNLPVDNVMLNRIQLSSTDDDALLVSFVVNNTELMPQRFLSQINAQFADKEIIQPVELLKNLPFDAYITNLTASPVDVSIICETYKS